MKFNRYSETERYVRAATRGLWGKPRQALKTELRGHISARVQEFRLGGLSEPEAERQTLRELGAPVRVSGGMLGVHTLPALGKAGALTALLMTGLFTVLPQGLAQVGSVFDTKNTVVNQIGTGLAVSSLGGYLDLNQLKQELKKAGGLLETSKSQYLFTVPGGPITSFSVAFKNAQSVIVGQKTYLYAGTAVVGLMGTGADLKLSGWNNPVLQAGNSSIQIQSTDWRVLSSLYFTSMQYTSPELYMGNRIELTEPNGNTGVFNLTGGTTEGHIYGLVTTSVLDASLIAPPKGAVLPHHILSLNISFDQAQGQRALFRIPNDALNNTFYASVAEFTAALERSRNASGKLSFDAKHPAPALLLELSGHFGTDAYTVVNPASVKGTITDH